MLTRSFIEEGCEYKTGPGRSPLAENFEDQREELYQRDPDGYIDRNLQPAARLMRPTQQLRRHLRGLLQGIGQLLKRNLPRISPINC